jgi:nucleoside-diphosphate-sugar epimerase
MAYKRPETIDEIAEALIKALKEIGWDVHIETQYPGDHWELNAYKPEGLLKAFTRLDVNLFSLGFDPKKVEIRFHFYADPRLIGPNKRAFGKKIRENNFELIKNVINFLFRKSGIKPTKEENMITPYSQNKIKFSEKEYFKAAFTIKFVYFNKTL